jgi:hypothetical protein
MAEKRSKSILSSLKNMLHRDPEKPDSAPKSSGSTRKKSAAPAAKKPAPTQGSAPDRGPSAVSANTPAAQEAAADAKPEKKKIPNQPWYRHRQRW